ncbi:MAG: Pr6Pr family membrane protein [Leifsonia flava]
MGSRIVAAVFRLFFAALSLTAVGVQFFAVTVPQGHSILNFFSYFTNLSNIIVSIVFIVSAVRLLRGVAPSTSDVAVRGASVVYIAFVGLVFNTLLRDVDLGGLIPWVNAVVHFIVPIAAVVDWLIWPPRRPLPWSSVLYWMIFPAVYVAYSLIRGAITDFYPYPFFSPVIQNGYGGVAAYCAVMIVGFLVLAVLIRWLGNALGAARVRRDEASVA